MILLPTNFFLVFHLNCLVLVGRKSLRTTLRLTVRHIVQIVAVSIYIQHTTFSTP